MKCPKCGFDDSKVVDSRPADEKIRRRRECLKCGFRFTTYEVIENIQLLVKKKDGSLEPFDKQKLIERILRSTAKRPVNMDTLTEMVDGITAEIKEKGNMEISSTEIGDMVLRRLKDIDRVAYIRFASVYMEFNDIESFVKIITELSEEEKDKR